jgi:hypothetical protein
MEPAPAPPNRPTYLVYMDDSRDKKLCCCSALMIPADEWQRGFAMIRDWRRSLKHRSGVLIYKELHATDLVAGRGRLGDRIVPKGRRVAIFKEGLQLVTQLPGAALINAVFAKDDDDTAYEWLLNRVNRTMKAWKTHAILFWDQGKEAQYRRLTRKMRVRNPIPSAFGQWETGTITKNIPAERILEDPVFKDSRQSYMIQLTDFCAFALLCQENPIPSRTRYGLNKAFPILTPILFLPAASKDPQGIVRGKIKG